MDVLCFHSQGLKYSCCGYWTSAFAFARERLTEVESLFHRERLTKIETCFTALGTATHNQGIEALRGRSQLASMEELPCLFNVFCLCLLSFYDSALVNLSWPWLFRIQVKKTILRSLMQPQGDPHHHPEPTPISPQATVVFEKKVIGCKKKKKKIKLRERTKQTFCFYIFMLLYKSRYVVWMSDRHRLMSWILGCQQMELFGKN